MVLRQTLSALPRDAWLLPFAELGVDRLYALLALRQEVFVLEQRCLYPDCDGRDAAALHLGFDDAAGLYAYARLFLPGTFTGHGRPTAARFGRVLTAPRARGQGHGERLVAACVAALEALAPGAEVEISAQSHLAAWYGRHGFVPVGEGYLEDGIPHVDMVRAPRR